MWSRGSIERWRRAINAAAQAVGISASVLTILPLLIPLSGAAVAFALGHPWIGAFAAGAAAMLCALVVLLALPLRGALRRILYGFRYRVAETTLHIDADGPRVHRRTSRYCVKIVRTGIRRIPDRYCAPGPGREARRLQSHGPRAVPGHRPRVVSGAAKIVGLLWDSDDECWNYLMDLGAPMSAGAQREIKLEQAFDFCGVGYDPRLQRTILDPTDRLILRIRMPAERWPVTAEGEEFLPEHHPRTLPVNVDEAHREVTLDVAKPKFGHVYRLRWSSVSPRSQSPTPAVDARPADSYTRRAGAYWLTRIESDD